MAVGLVVTGPAWPAAAQADRVEQIATQGYVYGYSPVAAARTRAESVCHTPPNALQNATRLASPLTRAVVAPNVDTLYSIGWLDLRSGPVTLAVPDTSGRYVVFQFLDIYTNTFANVGTRLNGSQPGTYAIVPPGWEGTLPAGVVAVPSPSWDVWMIGRTLVDGPDGLDAAQALQSQYVLTATNTGAPGPVPPTLPPVNCQDAPDPQTPYDAGAAFFDELAAVLASDPPPATDQPMLDQLATIGVTPGATPSSGDPETVAALEAAVTAGEAQVQASVADVTVPSGTWDASLNGGTYGTDYVTRAGVAVIGLGANVPEESLYYWSTSDAAGQPLVGTTTYRLHFEEGQLPPVAQGAFWSLTMYDEDMFLVPNAQRRYALGDRDDLMYNADGSLDLYLSASRPAGHASNWLPAPKAPFNLIIRAYAPSEAALTNSWNPPPITPHS